ncbi:MAG: hypothetical protein ACUVTL_04255 [Thermoproteota archaeon]
MKRYRKRYILLSFSSVSSPIKEQAKYIDDLLKSKRIRASIIQHGPDFLIYRCSHTLVDDFRRIFPITLSDNTQVVVKGTSGSLKGLRNKFIQGGQKAFIIAPRHLLKK